MSKITSEIEQQKEYLKSQGKKLSVLWKSEVFKKIRYLNFALAKPKSK